MTLMEFFCQETGEGQVKRKSVITVSLVICWLVRI